MSNIISPDQAQPIILALFASLPSKRQSMLIDELKAIIDGDKGWEMDCESDLEVEIIDGVDQDDFYSHRHDRD